MKQIEQQNKRVSPSPQKGAITERGLFRLMLPSLLGILLCSTCLAGLTWAYFSDSVTSSANTITAATFTVEVTITEITENAEENTLMANEFSMETTAPSTENPTEVGTNTGTGTQQGVTITGEGSTSEEGTSEGGSVSQTEAAGEGSTTGEGSTSEEGTSEAGSEPENEAAGEGTLAAANSPNTVSETDPQTPTPNTTKTVERSADGNYTLAAGKKYTVKLTASGTTKGYCKVTVNGTDYYTVKMDPAQVLDFDIDCSGMTSETTVTITPGWVNSDYPTTETNQINNGTTIGTPTTDDNTTEQSASAAAKTEEPLSEETVQSNKQTPVEPTPVEPTPVEPTPVEQTPAEQTPAEQTPAEQTPSEETTNAGEPTGTTSEEQSEE